MKKSGLFLTALFFAAALYGQQAADSSNQVEDEIELPDVTTVISGGAITAGKEAVPDYKPILPDASTGGLELPSLGKVEENSVPSQAFVPAGGSEKTVFAEGQIGGGFPFNFLGDFAIYRTTGNAPFAINFLHDAKEGFGSKKASDGYFERYTAVNATKEFNSKKGSNKFYGAYVMKNEGLQEQSDTFTDEIWHSINAGYDGKWGFNNGMYVSLASEGNFYNRYGTEFAASSADDWEVSATTLDLSPSFGLGWKNKGFSIGFNAAYSTILNLKDSDTLLKAEGSSSAEASHRGCFKVNSGYELENFNFNVEAAAVIGTAIGSNPVIVPFSVRLWYLFPVVNPAWAASVTLEGGCKSYQTDIRQIESTYGYTVAAAIPVETTDWYGDFNLKIPVKDLAALDFSADFARTAFDNGIWAPDYSSSGNLSGFYIAGQENRTEFSTTAAGTVNLGQLKLSASWKQHWKDVPVLEDEFSVFAKIMYQTPDAKWTAETSAKESFDDGADKVPQIDGSVALRVSNSIRLALDVKDVIKLCANETRSYAHSKYEARSGNLSLLVKFQF